MKFTVNVECTPQEARAFFGLPDLQPMQDRLMGELESRLRDNMRSLDPEAFLKAWMPTSLQGWQDMQKIFWAQMSTTPAREG